MIKKSLTRSDSFQSAYKDWKSSTDKTSLLRQLRSDFESSFFGYASSEIDLIRTPTYHMLIYKRNLSLEDAQYLSDYWKECLLQNSYTLYMSDVRSSVQDGGKHENIERHYLKPDIYDALLQGEPVDRKYGNITIELHRSDLSFEHLKLTQAFYHERDTQLPKGLDALMEYLLK